MWRKNAENDSAVQRNPNLTLPQFELKEVTVGECRSSYITGGFYFFCLTIEACDIPLLLFCCDVV